MQLLKNHPENQSATRVEISGTVTNTDVGVFTTIVELLKNAFIQPLQKDLEERIVVKGKDVIVKKNGGKENKTKDKD